MVIVGREATCTGCTANRGHAYTLFSSSLVLHILPLVPTILLSFVFSFLAVHREHQSQIPCLSWVSGSSRWRAVVRLPRMNLCIRQLNINIQNYTSKGYAKILLPWLPVWIYFLLIGWEAKHWTCFTHMKFCLHFEVNSTPAAPAWACVFNEWLVSRYLPVIPECKINNSLKK